MNFEWFGEQIGTRQTSRFQELVCVTDGAPTAWKKLQALMKTLGVTIICILDIFHVMDYLWDTSAKAIGTPVWLVVESIK